MKKRSGLAIVAMLLSSAVFAGGPDDSSKTPEQVVDLYLAAVIGSNADKAKEINDYLRTVYNGDDALNVAAIGDFPNRMVERLKATIMQAEPDKSSAIDAAVEALAKAVVATLQHTSCHATGSTVKPNEYKPGKFIATVSYECRVPDVTQEMKRTGLDKEKGKGNQTPLTFLNKLTDLVTSTPVDGTVKEVFTLYSTSDKQHWYTENPTEPIGAVINGIMGDSLQ